MISDVATVGLAIGIWDGVESKRLEGEWEYGWGQLLIFLREHRSDSLA